MYQNFLVKLFEFLLNHKKCLNFGVSMVEYNARSSSRINCGIMEANNELHKIHITIILADNIVFSPGRNICDYIPTYLNL